MWDQDQDRFFSSLVFSYNIDNEVKVKELLLSAVNWQMNFIGIYVKYQITLFDEIVLVSFTEAGSLGGGA